MTAIPTTTTVTETISSYAPRFFESQAITFRRVEDFEELQTDTRRLYYNTEYEDIENICNNIQIRQSDGFWFQFRAEYIYYKAYLVDEDSNIVSDITSDIVAISSLELSDNMKQYECVLDLTGITGYHSIRIIFDGDYGKPIYNFQSQWFDIETSFENALLIEWSNAGSLSTNNDGIIWSGATQKMWINSRLSDYVPGLDASVYVTSTGKQITTQATPFKSKKWEVKKIPAYIVEIINLARSKAYFYINEERYSAVENLDTERLSGISEYPFEMTVRLIETAQGNGYEDYTEDQEATGILPEVVDGYSLINDSDFSIINDDEDLNKLTN
ncbi:hypothetical protein RPMD05_85 [Rhodobacteraceae phage LS06-2018-MD05]|nr:hypothetical protein RPMD05_85 [Rhodobacteraceae phage LS06-2018-MD05]